MYYFTADEHYGHSNIIKYCDRPFEDVDEMDECMLDNHNSVVKSGDTVVHIGDFSLYSRVFQDVSDRYIKKLNGTNIFIIGSHDQWLRNAGSHIWQKAINGQQVVCCHYALARWPASHYNSWHLFGHTHGRFENHGKSIDVGVDSHNFTPVSFEKIIEIMKNLPDNPDLIRR